ncbi:MAG: hypothetical protein QXG17_01820 [Sulfolobales archaeon]
MNIGRIVSSVLLATSVSFFALSIWFAYIERYIPSLLSLTSGLILLSSALGILKELLGSRNSGR